MQALGMSGVEWSATRVEVIRGVGCVQPIDTDALRIEPWKKSAPPAAVGL
jgi:hypothetical protein